MVKATSVKDVDQHEIVKQIAGFLKKSGKVKVPEWSDLVKLGITKELAPVDVDWYYVRTASIARRLYIRSPTGMLFPYYPGLALNSKLCYESKFYLSIRLFLEKLIGT
ncbi:hypothetical protein AB6A40_011324 [Gnathostoma spinigerum]|uniref:Ribosomal protein S19 n=1 Tax=Gnathostoma spinigerum TaxID=75299 RepID=A0ABD6F4J7_9BILA